MRKGLLGLVAGVALMVAQSVGAADMIKYDKSASKAQPEQTVAQIQMDASCQPHCRPACRPCHRQCPPKRYKKRCHSQKQSVKKQAAQKSGHNESIEEKKMSSEGGYGYGRKTSYQGNNSGRNNDGSFVEEYIDEVGREHR